MSGRSLSSPYAVVRAQSAPSPRTCRASAGARRRAARSRSAAPTSRSGCGSARASSSICLRIAATGSPGTLRELRDVVAVVAVLRRLLPTPHRVDRRAEAVHLRARVVVVVLALDLVARELEQPRDGVAVRAVPRRRDGDRPGRVRRHHLDLHALRRLAPSRRRSPRRRRGSPAAPRANHASVRKRLTKPGPATSARSTSGSACAASASSAASSRGACRRAPASRSATFVA